MGVDGHFCRECRKPTDRINGCYFYCDDHWEYGKTQDNDNPLSWLARQKIQF